MAGDWIKVEKATPAKPEVLFISEILGVHPVHAFGLCVKFWMWCDDHLTDGNARCVTKVTLDFVIGHTGLTDALIKVGWLRDRSGSLEVPRFDRHLSEGAKNRALTKERVKKAKEKSNADSVSNVTQMALLEKRREDNNTASLSHAAREIPDWKTVQAFAAQIGLAEWRAEDEWNKLESNGWVDAKGNALRKWQPYFTRVRGWWESEGRPMTRPSSERKAGGGKIKSFSEWEQEKTGIEPKIKLKKLQ